jgi:hypothetical protein
MSEILLTRRCKPNMALGTGNRFLIASTQVADRLAHKRQAAALDQVCPLEGRKAFGVAVTCDDRRALVGV